MNGTVYCVHACSVTLAYITAVLYLTSAWLAYVYLFKMTVISVVSVAMISDSIYVPEARVSFSALPTPPIVPVPVQLPVNVLVTSSSTAVTCPQHVVPITAVLLGVALGVLLGVALGLGVAEGVLDGVPDGVELGVFEGVAEGLGVLLGVLDGVADAVPLGVEEGVPEGVELGVADGVPEGVAEVVDEGVPLGYYLE